MGSPTSDSCSNDLYMNTSAAFHHYSTVFMDIIVLIFRLNVLVAEFKMAHAKSLTALNESLTLQILFAYRLYGND